MAKTGFITIPDGLDIAYNRVIQSGDRFIYPHVKVKRLFTSRSKKKGLSQKSLIVQLAPVWNAFDQSVRDAWNDAGLESGMTGFKLFIQDTAVRRANDIAGYATPNTLFQSKVGKIQIESPAVGLTILQLHPQSYYVNRKVSGTRSQYEPKLIQENITLPIDIAISYQANLVSAGDNPSARFHVTVYSNYQGRTIENVCEIPFTLVHDWERLTASISGVIGVFRGYTAFIEIHDARGTLLFDNIEIVHTGQNWARDPYCNSIQTTFTKAFYQIPKNWIADEIIDGAFYVSVYSGLFPPYITVGPNSASSASSESSPGEIAWVSPNDAKVSDGVYSFSSTAIPFFPFSTTSRRLKLIDFGFSIPNDAVIKGILVEVQRKEAHLNGGGASDNEIKLVKGGSITSLNKAVAGVWPTSEAFSSYGGEYDLWDNTWSPSDINASDFGVVVRANLVSTGGSPIWACAASVDCICVTIYYGLH